jgi:hypothetical protein
MKYFNLRNKTKEFIIFCFCFFVFLFFPDSSFFKVKLLSKSYFLQNLKSLNKKILYTKNIEDFGFIKNYEITKKSKELNIFKEKKVFQKNIIGFNDEILNNFHNIKSLFINKYKSLNIDNFNFSSNLIRIVFTREQVEKKYIFEELEIFFDILIYVYPDALINKDFVKLLGIAKTQIFNEIEKKYKNGLYVYKNELIYILIKNLINFINNAHFKIDNRYSIFKNFIFLYNPEKIYRLNNIFEKEIDKKYFYYLYDIYFFPGIFVRYKNFEFENDLKNQIYSNQKIEYEYIEEKTFKDKYFEIEKEAEEYLKKYELNSYIKYYINKIYLNNLDYLVNENIVENLKTKNDQSDKSDISQNKNNVKNNNKNNKMKNNLKEENYIFKRKEIFSYIKIKSFDHLFDKSLKRFVNDANILKKEKFIIIDLRDNEGGNIEYVKKWIKNFFGIDYDLYYRSFSFENRLKYLLRMNYYKAFNNIKFYNYSYDMFLKLEKDYFNFDIEENRNYKIENRENDRYIFIIQNNKTSSLSELFINFLKKFENVFLIGTNTKGAMIYGDPGLLYLNKLNLIILIPTRIIDYSTTNNPEGIGILPDIWLFEEKNNYSFYIDFIKKVLLNYIKK